MATIPKVGFERTQTKASAPVTVRGAPGGDASVAPQQVRGLGTDVAIVSSMVFLAQFIQALCVGSLVSAVGSTVAVVAVAAFLAFCGAVSATQVEYLDL